MRKEHIFAARPTEVRGPDGVEVPDVYHKGVRLVPAVQVIEGPRGHKVLTADRDKVASAGTIHYAELRHGKIMYALPGGGRIASDKVDNRVQGALC